MAMSKIVRGTMLLTSATFLSKLLGTLYVIPFEALVGDSGGALFQYAYIPYSIFISVATVGVPLAVSKFVSKYNSLGDYETGRRMFTSGLTLMSITGFIAFLILFFGAGFIATLSIEENAKGISVEDVKMVIQMVSFALILVPGMSIVRGFFQGYESMGPTALSQVIEQIVRILFLLTSVFLVLHVFNGAMPTAVGFAAFAAFIGAVASCIVLWGYWKKRKPYLDRKLHQQKFTYNLPVKTLYKELLRYAGPFVMVGIAIPLYQLIDQLTFYRTMAAIGEEEIAQTAFATISLYGHKLVILPVTLATGLSLAMLPVITKSFTENKKQQLFQQMNQSMQIILLIVIPAVVGLMLLSHEAYATFYGVGDNIATSGSLLRWYAPVGLFFALFTVSSSILQGINQQNHAVVSLIAGLLIKGLLNVPLIHIFGAKGAIFATFLGTFTAVALNLWRIKTTVNFPFRELIKRTMLIGIFTIIMSITVWLTKWLLSFFIAYQDGRMIAVVILLVCAVAGAGIYVWFSYHSTLLERVLGNRIRFLDKIFKRNDVKGDG